MKWNTTFEIVCVWQIVYMLKYHANEDDLIENYLK